MGNTFVNLSRKRLYTEQLYISLLTNKSQKPAQKAPAPVPYMDSGIPHPTVPGEGSEMISNNNGLVAVIGNGQIMQLSYLSIKNGTVTDSTIQSVLKV